MAGYIILAILLLLVLFFAVLVLRALFVKPNSALDAKLPEADPQRSRKYGERLAQMIRKETISSRFNDDKSKFYEFHETLKELFPNIHKTCEKHDFNGSLLYRWKGKGNGKPILLMSHQDVVAAEGEWEHDPFGGEIIDGAVWGRGTVDTKGSLFCLMTAVEELIADGYVPECDVYLASSCTEEFSGEGAPLTVKYLKEQGIELELLIDEGGMIINNPIGGVNGTYAMVGVLEKGYGDLRFIAKGKGGHASAPGKNTPWARLARFICSVEKKSPFSVRFNPTVEEMFRRFTPNMSFGMKLIFANFKIFAPLLRKLMPVISSQAAAMISTTIAFTMGKGSDGLNVLPQEAYVTGNLRFIPHQGTDESIALITEAAKKYDIETEVIYKDYPCPVVDYTAPQFKLVEETVHEIYPGIGVVPYAMTGGTDAKYYSDICKNCIRFAPLAINKQQYGSIHAANENINCDALPAGVDFYKSIILKMPL
ncbi:MAG: M20/M25/M40 family metallo-hydrolase [Lachnospiraceae bacterium]|nr:M20/M25/M40 family metallo-hydrolase [Lachnospiraceae bacterium]